nr:Gfo/Idh/MocA family oxidoreductase [Bradyrhizobium sp. 21]
MSKAFTSSLRNRSIDASRQPFRWAIAGYGDVVQRRVAPAILAGENVVLAGIWGRTLARASETAVRFGTVATDAIAPLCDSIDALYVATPVSSHMELATLAAGAGCHVLIEKPLSAGLGQVSPLAQLARSKSLCIGVAYYRRLLPAVRWLGEEIRSGRFGRSRSALVQFSMPYTPSPNDPMVWRYDRMIAGGGVLADAGSHRLDILSILFGPPVSLIARFLDVTAGGCERAAQVSLAWQDGLVAQLDVAWRAHHQDRLEIEFESAGLVLDPLDGGTAQISWRDGRTDWLELPGSPNLHEPLVRDFELAVRNQHAPACDLSGGILVDRMLAAAAISNSTGSAVRLDMNA